MSTFIVACVQTTSSRDVSINIDVAIFITEWPEFKQLDLKRLTQKMTNAIIFDGRNIYDINEMKKLNIEYHSIGRPSYYP